MGTSTDSNDPVAQIAAIAEGYANPQLQWYASGKLLPRMLFRAPCPTSLRVSRSRREFPDQGGVRAVLDDSCSRRPHRDGIDRVLVALDSTLRREVRPQFEDQPREENHTQLGGNR